MNAYCSSCGSKTETRLVAKQQLSVCPNCDRIFFRNPKVGVPALSEDGGRVLPILRDIEPGRGLWGMPGGYVDWDEHPEEALIRECMEEVQVRIEPLELLEVQHILIDDEGSVLLPYHARLLGGNPPAGDGGEQVGWFRPEALPPLAFASHRTVLQHWTLEVLARGAA